MPGERAGGDVFGAPKIGSPRAIGSRYGNTSGTSTDIIYPVSKLVNGQFQSGRTLEFNWKSDKVIAEELYKQTRNGTTTITQTSTLWDDMSILASLKPSPVDLEFTLAGTAAQYGNVLAVTELPPQHLLGSEISHTGIPAD